MATQYTPSKYALPYPDENNPVAVPDDLKALALRAGIELGGVEGRVTTELAASALVEDPEHPGFYLTGASAGTPSPLVRFTDTETVKVDPATGSDTADGMATPLATVGEAVRRAEQTLLGPDRLYIISLAAGTYSEQVEFAEYTNQALNMVITGPDVGGHPNVPSVHFTMSAGAGEVAIRNRNPNLRLLVQDIRFSGYNGTTSSAGISNLYGHLYTVNVHTDTCFYGISSVRGVLDVKGGILDNNGRLPDNGGSGAAIRSLMLNRHSIGTQGAGNLNSGPIITNNRYGVYAQESSTGHVDWCTVHDNEKGVVLRVNSRANCDGVDFRRNTDDIVADGNSHCYVPNTVNFGTGADKSSRTVTLYSGSETTTQDHGLAGVQTAYSRTERAVYGVYTKQTVTGTLTETDLLNRTLTAPWWNDDTITGVPPKRLQFQLFGSLTGTAGTKTLVLRLGTRSTSVVFAATETGSFTLTGQILFVSPTRQILTLSGTRDGGTTARTKVSAIGENMAVDQSVRVAAILGNGTDTLAAEAVELAWG